MRVLQVCRHANGIQPGTGLYCCHVREAEEGHTGSNEGLPSPIPWLHCLLVKDVLREQKIQLYSILLSLHYYIIIIKTLASIWHASPGYFPSPRQFVAQRVLSQK